MDLARRQHERDDATSAKRQAGPFQLQQVAQANTITQCYELYQQSRFQLMRALSDLFSFGMDGNVAERPHHEFRHLESTAKAVYEHLVAESTEAAPSFHALVEALQQVVVDSPATRASEAGAPESKSVHGSMADGRSNHSSVSLEIPPLVRRYFDALGTMKLHQEILWSDVPAEYADEVAERQRLRDQDHSLSENDDQFEERYRKRRISLENSIQDAQACASNLRQACELAELDVNPAKYSRRNYDDLEDEVQSINPVHQWLQGTQSVTPADVEMPNISRLQTPLSASTTQAEHLGEAVTLEPSGARYHSQNNILPGAMSTIDSSRASADPSFLNQINAEFTCAGPTSSVQRSILPREVPPAVTQLVNDCNPLQQEPRYETSTSFGETSGLIKPDASYYGTHQDMAYLGLRQPPHEGYDLSGQLAMTSHGLSHLSGDQPKLDLVLSPGDDPFATDDHRMVDSGYCIQRRNFFVTGRVFLSPWVEPAGEKLGPGPVPGGSTPFKKTQWFVVIREGDQYCSALHIVSYGREGVAKRGVKKSDHCIIYAGNREPLPVEGERLSNGRGLRSQAIRVQPDSANGKLSAMSRLSFGQVYTVYHNIKVKPFGRVVKESIDHLLAQFRAVWMPDLEEENNDTREATNSDLTSRRARTNDSSNAFGPKTVVSSRTTSQTTMNSQSFASRSKNSFGEGKVFEIVEYTSGPECAAVPRLFVIIEQRPDSSTALPIDDYGFKGVGQEGVKKSDHAIIHTDRKAPTEMAGEKANRDEEPMRSHPIRVKAHDRQWRLPRSARVNMGRPIDIDPHRQVKLLGWLDPNNLALLRSQFLNVQRGEAPETAVPAQPAP